METQSILAIPQAEDKEMVLHLGTQFPTHVQVTGALQRPWDKRLCTPVFQFPAYVTRTKIQYDKHGAGAFKSHQKILQRAKVYDKVRLSLSNT